MGAFGTILLDILRETAWVFLEAAPYVVLGLLVAAVIYMLISTERIESALGKPGIGSILKAALLGIPLPLCSCGVLPTALSMRERGASRGATVSFLVSTPETGLDSIAVTYALINPAMTILRPLSAFISAVAAGFTVERFGGPVKETDQKTVSSCSTCGGDSCETSHGLASRIRSGLNYIVNDFFPDIANWIVIGLVISGIVAAVVPQDFLARVPPSTQLFLAVVAGVPIYICASASTPIAAVLMAKGVAPGAALVFLLVGPATNLASLLVIGHRMGKRAAGVYLGTLIVTSLAIGWAVDTYMGNFNWIPKLSDPALADNFGWFHWLGAAVLLMGLVNAWRLQLRKRFARVPAAPHSGCETAKV